MNDIKYLISISKSFKITGRQQKSKQKNRRTDANLAIIELLHFMHVGLKKNPELK